MLSKNKHKQMMKRIVFLLLLLPLFALAQQQQDTIKMNEVVIDASKTNQRIQKMPISVTAISAKKLETLKVDNLTNLNGFVPNLFMPEHGTRLNTDIYIRGVGVSKGEASVGVYVDDIPYFDSGTVNFELAEVRKIEVLRGPQGTLYGRNTMGGLIKVYTPEPKNKLGGALKFDYGNYNQIKTVGNVNVPVSNKLAFLVDGAYAHKDGFFTNKFDDSKADEMDTYSGRFKAIYKPSSKVKIRFVLGKENSDQSGFPYAVYNPETQTINDINYNDPSAYNRDFLSGGVFAGYKGSKFDVNISGSYQKLVDNYEIDQDFLPTSVYFIDMDRDNKAFVQEISLKSKKHSNIQWVAGLFSFQRRLYKDVLVDLTSSHGTTELLKTYDQDIDGGAVFGQIEIPFGKLNLTTGIRFDMEKSSMDYNYDLVSHGRTIHRDDFLHYLSYEQVLPKIGLSYAVKDNFNVYATINKGYKAGGFNATIEREEDETYNPEYSWNYEAGLKSTWLDDKLTTNFSIFYIDWKDQQVVQSVPSGRGIMVKNAGKSESKGAELESYYQFNKDFNIALALGYTQAKFIDYEKNATTDYSGNYIPLIPEYTLGVAANYKYRTTALGMKYIQFNTNYKYFGKHYWDVDNVSFQDAYGLLNANISAVFKKYSFGIWGKNLTDANYGRYYFTISTLDKAYMEPSHPTQFGVFVKAKF